MVAEGLCWDFKKTINQDRKKALVREFAIQQ